MATIPLHVAQRRLDTGNAVQYPNGSPVGGAMQQLGDELSAIAERYQRMKAQQDAFDAEIARRQFNGRIAQAEDEVAANAPADGAGLHDAMYGQVDPRTGQVAKPGLFDTLFDEALPKIPESQRASFARQKEAMRAVGSVRMAARQQARRDDYEQAEWAAVDNMSTSSIAQGDPNDTATFEAIRQNGFDLIAKIGNPLARQAAEAAWRGNTAKALVQAMIAQDPKRAAEMLGGVQAAAAATQVGGGTSAAGSAVAATKGAEVSGDPVAELSTEKEPAQANSVQLGGKPVWAAGPWIADLSPEDIQDLDHQAQVSTAASLVDARANISLAYQNAPDALLYTGSYPGKTPGPEDFTAVYGVEEGNKQFQGLSRVFDVGREAFGMRVKSTEAIENEVLAGKPKPGGATPEQDQARYEITRSAALQILYARWADAGGYVRKVFPIVDAAWNKVTRPDSESWNRRGVPDSYDPSAYGNAMAVSVAAQKQMGIENIRPLPLAVVQNIAEAFNDKDVPQADKDAILRDLSAGASDPSVRAALAHQLAQAGLPPTIQSAPNRSVVPPDVVQATGPSQPNERSGKSQSAFGQAAGDFGNYLNEGFEALRRIPHDIGIFLEDLRSDPLDAVVSLSNSVPNPASGAPAESVAALKALGQALSKGLTTIRGVGGGRLARPLEELAASSSPAASNLAAGGGLTGRVVGAEYAAAKDAARRLSAGLKPDKVELAEIIKSIARDPSGVKYPGASFGRAVSKNYRKTFLDAHPKLEGKVVVHHAAERQVSKRYSGLVGEEEIHSLENLRGIPKELDNLLHLTVFRFEWDEFYRLHPNATRQQVLDYVAYIDKKYGHLFNPPIGE